MIARLESISIVVVFHFLVQLIWVVPFVLLIFVDKISVDVVGSDALVILLQGFILEKIT
jgi:hypothetical protein